MATDAETAIQRVSPFRAGLATMLVGAVILGVGMLQTTAATPQTSCPHGTYLKAKFEWKGNRYQFVEPNGNRDYVRITNGTAKGGNWNSDHPIAAIIVKGGPGSKTITYTPPQTSGSFDNKGLTTGGRGKNTPDVSHVLFCAPVGQPTTTTTEATTTTESTTTTTESTTTTTEATTTTSEPEETTTTTESTTTTTTSTSVPEETTTSTTEPEGSTTTEPEGSTTTEPEETTTTEAGETTTTAGDGTTTTTVGGGEVQGRVVVNTTIVADDTAAVLASGRSLPRTGAPSVPLVMIGIILLASGATISVLNRRREAGN